MGLESQQHHQGQQDPIQQRRQAPIQQRRQAPIQQAAPLTPGVIGAASAVSAAAMANQVAGGPKPKLPPKLLTEERVLKSVEALIMRLPTAKARFRVIAYLHEKTAEAQAHHEALVLEKLKADAAKPVGHGG